MTKTKIYLVKTISLVGLALACLSLAQNYYETSTYLKPFEGMSVVGMTLMLIGLTLAGIFQKNKIGDSK